MAVGHDRPERTNWTVDAYMELDDDTNRTAPTDHTDSTESTVAADRYSRWDMMQSGLGSALSEAEWRNKPRRDCAPSVESLDHRAAI